MDIQAKFNSTFQLVIQNIKQFELEECLQAMQFEDVFFHTMELDSEQFLIVYPHRADYAAWAGFTLMHEQLKSMLDSYGKSPCPNITISNITTLKQTYILFINGLSNELYGVVTSKNNTETVKELNLQWKESSTPVSNYEFKKGIIVPIEKSPNYFLNED